MGQLGLRERRSAVKAAAVRRNAQKPRPGARKRDSLGRALSASNTRKPGSRRDTRDRAHAQVARLQDLWPYCEQLALQVIADDLRDSRGRPLMEPVRDYQGKVIGRRRARVPIALRMSTAQDLWDRTGFSRETTQRIAGEGALPGIQIQMVGFPRPNAAQTVPVQPEEGERPATNGHAPAPQAEVTH